MLTKEESLIGLLLGQIGRLNRLDGYRREEVEYVSTPGLAEPLSVLRETIRGEIAGINENRRMIAAFVDGKDFTAGNIDKLMDRCTAKMNEG